MKIAVIADPDTALAFRLAGVEGRIAHSAADVTGLVEQLRREGAGLILITEELFDGIREPLEKIMRSPGGILILAVPAFKGAKRFKPRSIERIAAFLGR